MGPSRREFLQMISTAAAADVLAGGGANAAVATPVPTAASLESADGLCFMSAQELVGLIRARKLSARDVMLAHLRQIERVNPRVNAIVAKLDDVKCLALADEADRRIARGDDVGPLHGLPFAFKDTEAAIGFPFTRGSPIFKDDMPTEDTVLVERLRNAGVLPIGKTNVPEFGMGSHTYNKVYGTTRNPYDLTKSAGGSSGGAAAALAAGMVPLAVAATWADRAQPRQLQQRRRLSADGRTRAAPITLRLSASWSRARWRLGRRCRVPDERDGGVGPRDQAVIRRPDGVLARARSGPQGRARCLVPGPRRSSARSQGAIGPGSAASDLRAYRLYRREYVSGSRRCRRGVPYAACVAIVEHTRPAARRASCRDQARSDHRDRDRFQAERVRRRPCDEPACRDHGAGAAVSADLRIHDLRGEPAAPVRYPLDWPKEIERRWRITSWMKSAYWITVTFAPRSPCRVHA